MKRTERAILLSALMPAAASLTGACATAPRAAPATTVALDPQSNHIRFPATIRGKPVTVILDTGLDPSGVGLDKARELGLPVDESSKFPLSGVGEQQVFAYEGAIEGLVIGGRSIERLEAVADPGPAFRNQTPGRHFDVILGYNFLTNRVLLVDYINNRLSLLGEAGEARTLVRRCSQRHSIPLRSYEGDTIPIIPDFQIGPIKGPVSLDTGASTAINLFEAAVPPQVASLLPPSTDQVVTGARGNLTTKRVKLPFEIGFGPFRIAGQDGLIMPRPGSFETRIGNVGNSLFRALKLKMLLDYKSRQITFYGGCSG